MTKSPFKTIPLNKLSLSGLNVRKAAVDDLSDQELYASIKTIGIKQNLLVHEHDGNIQVHAGGRRLKTLQALAAEGIIAETYLVPCCVETQGQAEESSAAENMIRAAMHPADEFAAFKAMHDKGANEDDIALKFGTTPAVVRKRMKLANLAPVLFEAFRNNDLSMEAAKAFAISDDHARQVQVHESLKESRDLYPHNIRRALLEETCTAGSKLARFVGLEDYKAAGGEVIEDLFSDHNSTHLKDMALLERLALEKLEAAAAELRSAWKWAEPHLCADYDLLRQYGRVYPEPVEPNPALVEEHEALDRKLAQISEKYDEETWTDELQQEEELMSQRLAELEDLIENSETYSTAQMALAGCIVTLDHNGAIKVEVGLIRAGDIPDERERSSDANDDADMVDAVTITTPPASMARNVDASEPDDSGEPGLSQALTEELRATRNQIMKAHLAADFASAFDLMVYTMATHTLSSFVGASCYRETPLDARVSSTESFAARDALKDTIAARMLETLAEELDVSWMALPTPKDYVAMCALSDEKKQAIFAFCTAKGLKQQLGGPNADQVIELTGRRLNIDVASLWRPTARNYWGRVTKGHALSVSRELIDARWADDHASARKADLAASLEAAFGDDAECRVGITAATAARTRTWLPEGMGFDVVLEPAAAVPSGDDEKSRHEASDAENEEEEPSTLPAFLDAAE